jgi:hypothetical protein
VGRYARYFDVSGEKNRRFVFFWEESEEERTAYCTKGKAIKLGVKSLRSILLLT